MRVKVGTLRWRSGAKAAEGSYMGCPMTGTRVGKPCWNTACAFNTARPGSMVAAPDDCLLVLINSQTATDAERMSIAARAKAVTAGKDVSAAAVIKSVTMLGSAYQDFLHAAGVPAFSQGNCPHCGYVSTCGGKAICEERRAAMATALSGMESLLTAQQLWAAVLDGRASFLIPSRRKALADLVSNMAQRSA